MSPPEPDVDSAPGRSRVVVVGGGIGGLAAAHQILLARPDVDLVLVEATQVVGGKLRLGEVAGLRVDLGAESMLNRRPEGVELARAVGLADAVVHPETAAASLWMSAGLMPLPPTLMGIPADPASAVVLSEEGARRAAAEDTLPAVDVTEDVGVGVLVAERLGPEVRDRLVEPLLGGVYAGRADELSLHAALPQVAAGVREHGSLLARCAAVAVECELPTPRRCSPGSPAGSAASRGRWRRTSRLVGPPC